MTTDEVMRLAWKYANLVDATGLHKASASLRHLMTMPQKMAQISDVEKLMRWLGFMQGVLHAERVFNIDELRHHNKFGYED